MGEKQVRGLLWIVGIICGCIAVGAYFGWPIGVLLFALCCFTIAELSRLT